MLSEGTKRCEHVEPDKLRSTKIRERANHSESINNYERVPYFSACSWLPARSASADIRLIIKELGGLSF